MAEGMLNMAAGNVDLEHTHALRSGGGFRSAHAPSCLSLMLVGLRRFQVSACLT